jgi:hypothetical protein
MTSSWNLKKHPCGNLFCRLNLKGYCEAGDMLTLLCSDEDIYQYCKERVYGEKLIESLKKVIKFDVKKDNKHNLFEKL